VLDATVTITPNERGWSQVQLRTLDTSRSLGAEDLQYIAKHLITFLTDDASDVRWVLSLSEQHCSVYGEHTANSAVLRFQDANAVTFATATLTQTDIRLWLETLSNRAAI
jgi:hypothetical protein